MAIMTETASMTQRVEMPVPMGRSDYARMGRALDLLAEAFPDQPSLGDLRPQPRVTCGSLN